MAVIISVFTFMMLLSPHDFRLRMQTYILLIPWSMSKRSLKDAILERDTNIHVIDSGCVQSTLIYYPLHTSPKVIVIFLNVKIIIYY